MNVPPAEREPRRHLSADEIERTVAGISVGLELDGLKMTEAAEACARAVLTGEMTADEAIEHAIAAIRDRAES